MRRGRVLPARRGAPPSDSPRPGPVGRRGPGPPARRPPLWGRGAGASPSRRGPGASWAEGALPPGEGTRSAYPSGGAAGAGLHRWGVAPQPARLGDFKFSLPLRSDGA